MSGYAEARRLPRGWAHLALQFAVWFGFYAAYQVVRGAADRGGVAEALHVHAGRGPDALDRVAEEEDGDRADRAGQEAGAEGVLAGAV